MSAPDATTDPELEAVAWDLAPLLDDGGRPRGRRRRDARRPPRRRADAFAAAHAGKVAELDGPGLVAAHAGARRAAGARRPRRLLRHPELLRATPPTRRAARCCSACRRRRPRSRPRCCSSSSSGRRSTTTAPRSCSPPRGSTSRATTCAPRAATARTCSPSPRSGSSPRSALTGRTRVDAAVRGAGVGDHRRAARRDRAGLARGRDGAAVRARPRACGATPPSGSRRRSQPGPAHARVRVQHAARGQDGRRPAALASRTGSPAATSPTRPPTSPCRRWSRRSAPATRCRAAGTG